MAWPKPREAPTIRIVGAVWLEVIREREPTGNVGSDIGQTNEAASQAPDAPDAKNDCV